MVIYQSESNYFKIHGLSPEKMAIVSVYQDQLANMLQLAIENLYYENKGVLPTTLYEVGLVYWHGEHQAEKPQSRAYKEGLQRVYNQKDFMFMPESKKTAIMQVFNHLPGTTAAMLSAIFLKIEDLPDYKNFPLQKLKNNYRGIHGQVVNRLISFFYPEKERAGVLEEMN